MTIIKTSENETRKQWSGENSRIIPGDGVTDSPLEVTIYPCLVFLGALSSEEGLGIACWSILIIRLPKNTDRIFVWKWRKSVLNINIWKCPLKSSMLFSCRIKMKLKYNLNSRHACLSGLIKLLFVSRKSTQFSLPMDLSMHWQFCQISQYTIMTLTDLVVLWSNTGTSTVWTPPGFGVQIPGRARPTKCIIVTQDPFLHTLEPYIVSEWHKTQWKPEVTSQSSPPLWGPPPGGLTLSPQPLLGSPLGPLPGPLPGPPPPRPGLGTSACVEGPSWPPSRGGSLSGATLKQDWGGAAGRSAEFQHLFRSSLQELIQHFRQSHRKPKWKM